MNKVLKTFAFAAVAAVAITACNKEIEVTIPTEEHDFVYTFAIGQDAAMTKAILASDSNGKFAEWESGDRLGSITTKTSGYSSITPANGDNPATFSIYSKGGLSEGNTITVWYPYGGSTQSNASAVNLAIPEEQQHLANGKFDFDAMPMVAKQITVTADMVSTTNNTTLGTVNFANLASLLNFKVFSTKTDYAGEKVKSITFNAKNEAGTEDANIGGTFTKNLATIDPDDESTMAIGSFTSGVSSIVTTPYADAAIGTSKANALDLYMVVAPGTYKGTIVVKTDVATYTYTISNAATLSRSGIKAYGLDLGSSTAARDARALYTITQADVPFSGSGYNDYEDVVINALDAKFTFKQIMKSGSNFQLKTSAAGFIANTTAIGAKIHSIVFSTVTNSVNVTAGTTADALSADKVTASGNTYTFADGCKFFKIAAGGSYAVIGNITVYYYPANWVLNSIEVTKEPGKKDYEAGESFDPTGMEVTAHYIDADDNTNTKDVILDNTDLEITPSADLTQGTTSVTITYGGKTTTQNITVTAPTPKKVDVLNYSWTEVSGSGYQEFSSISGSSSDAVYAGQVNAGVNYIQLRNQKPSGIVTTQSGGILKSISITWNSSTGNDRSLSVYAKNTAYTESADLYDANKKGTLVHTFTKSAGDASWTFTDDYEYVGLLASGALYIDEINITWIPVTWTLSSIEVTTAPTKTTYEAGESFDPSGMVVTAHYVDESNSALTKEVILDNADLTFNPSTSEALTTSITSVTISYGSKTTTQDITVNAPITWDLKSIEVTNVPTKTTYTEGEFFDPSGMVVTGHFVDAVDATNTKDEAVTGYTITPNGALATTDTQVTITYKGKTTTQAITVNASSGVTVSMDTFTDISGYVDGDTNVSYSAEKGAAANAPAVNSDEIRIYQNGGTLTITANNNKKITSVTIGSSMATTVTVSVDGGSASANNSISANGTYTKDNIEASTVLFTCTGTTKTSRLYLNYLSVTYN